MRLPTLIGLVLFACSVSAQSMTWDEWEQASANNKRMLPEYGHLPKSAAEQQADSSFIADVMKQEQFKGDRRAASDHTIGLGFTYLYKGDLKTAMYRFNQAYLLDTTNADAHWGYGAICMTLGNLAKGREQYEEGLAYDPDNTHLLTDLGTYYMQLYLVFANMPANTGVKDPQQEAEHNLDSALVYLNRSYVMDAKDPNTTFKLSTTNYYAGDCASAWRFYDECQALGGQPITEAYTKELKRQCKRKK